MVYIYIYLHRLSNILVNIIYFMNLTSINVSYLNIKIRLKPAGPYVLKSKKHIYNSVGVWICFSNVCFVVTDKRPRIKSPPKYAKYIISFCRFVVNDIKKCAVSGFQGFKRNWAATRVFPTAAKDAREVGRGKQSCDANDYTEFAFAMLSARRDGTLYGPSHRRLWWTSTQQHAFSTTTRARRM